jgi:ATP-dependent helicase/nuclease subunit B
MAAFYGIEVEEPIILDKNYRLAENEELSFMEQQLFRKRRCGTDSNALHGFLSL